MEWLRQLASVPARRARDSREAAELREAAKKGCAFGALFIVARAKRKFFFRAFS
jgi:hypothetical protein